VPQPLDDRVKITLRIVGIVYSWGAMKAIINEIFVALGFRRIGHNGRVRRHARDIEVRKEIVRLRSKPAKVARLTRELAAKALAHPAKEVMRGGMVEREARGQLHE